jgi:hypothetical protein
MGLPNSQGDTPIAFATSKILILAREPLAAALLGLLVELDTYEPAFPLPRESPEEAVRRGRPALVILLNGSVEAAASDVFHARAKGTPVILFGTPRTMTTVQALADARGLRWFMLPTDRASLTQVIHDAVASSLPRSGRDRRRPTARQAPDGTLMYRDREGSEWRVYDRRVGERRGKTYRAFVNHVGEEWRYELTGKDKKEKTAAALERQLAAAVRHG